MKGSRAELIAAQADERFDVPKEPSLKRQQNDPSPLLKPDGNGDRSKQPVQHYLLPFRNHNFRRLAWHRDIPVS